MPTFRDAHHAISSAQQDRPIAIGWDQRISGWENYDPTQGCPPHLEPEILCLGLGQRPLALSECGAHIISTLLASR